MASYEGRHAELYGVFYADKPYQAEAAFVHGCLERFSTGPNRKVLEIACGTGRHAFELERLGHSMVATDYSADMLACGRRRAAEVGSAVDFRLQDMRDLDVPERPFDAVVCLFDSIGYVATNEGVMRVLSGVRNHLRPGAVFVFEFWHAAAMLRGYDPVRVRRFPVDGGEVVRISETALDCQNQLCRVTYTVIETRADGTCHRFTETQVNRFFLVQEMAAALSSAGLDPLAWFSGFDAGARITEDTWHVVAVARRP